MFNKIENSKGQNKDSEKKFFNSMKGSSNRLFICIYSIVFIFLALIMTNNLAAEEKIDVLTFDKPFLFTYGSWKDKLEVKNSKAVVKAADSKGGGGYNVSFNFSGKEEMTPVLYATIAAGNSAKKLKVIFKDNKGKNAIFFFSLEGKATGEKVRILPKAKAKMNNPNVGKPINLTNLRQVQICGDWSGNPVELTINSLTLEKVK